MGGGQTLQVITAHPDQFAYVGVWSAGIGQNPGEWEKTNAAFLGNPKINSWVRLFSICAGETDFALNGSNQIHLSGGGHTWINWRRYLNDLAPRLSVPIS